MAPGEFLKAAGRIAVVVAGILVVCHTCEGVEGQAVRNDSAAGPRAVVGTEQSVAVVYTVRIIHNGKEALREPQIRMRLPVECPHQDIDSLQIEGSPRRVLDCWKEPVAVYRQPELACGGVLTGRWMAAGSIRELRWDLKRASGATDIRASGGADILVCQEDGRPDGRQECLSHQTTLSAAERALYLRDTENFVLADPAIKAAAREATAGRGGDVAKLEGIHDFIIKHLQYVRDGHWDPAPAVLASGKGSCSEYTYLFIALCRAGGIPARYVGGITARAGKPLHVDLVNHRFPQAFVEGTGWVDFDPTRDERSKTHRLFFGRTPCQMLLLCAGDGGEGSLTGGEYCSLELWKDKGQIEDDDSPNAQDYAPTAIVHVGWWLLRPPAEIERKVAAFRASLEKTASDKRRPLVGKALQIGHPFVLPWLDDLLYDPATRVEAARAFLKIGGRDALLAVVDNLCRQHDREGDRRIGELLDNFTGQHFGGDRKGWKNWIESNTRPSPLPAPG
jgi:hypothetical protein